MWWPGYRGNLGPLRDVRDITWHNNNNNIIMPCYYYWWWWGAQFYLIESRSAHLWLPGLLVHCYVINLQAGAAPSSKGNRHKRLLLFMTGHIFRCGASLDSLYVSVSVLKYHLQWETSSILLDTRTSKSKKISDKFFPSVYLLGGNNQTIGQFLFK